MLFGGKNAFWRWNEYDLARGNRVEQQSGYNKFKTKVLRFEFCCLHGCSHFHSRDDDQRRLQEKGWQTKSSSNLIPALC